MTFAKTLRSRLVEEHPLTLVTESVTESSKEPVQQAPSRKFVAIRCRDCDHWRVKGNLHNCPRPKIPAVPCKVTKNSPIGGDNKQVEHQ